MSYSQAQLVADLAERGVTFVPFQYDRWRHGGWYTSVRYPSGACGCVSRNYADRKWRIACDSRPGDHTYRSRDEAAQAEKELVAAGILA